MTHKEKRRASLRTTLDGCQRGSEGTPNKVCNVTQILVLGFYYSPFVTFFFFAEVEISMFSTLLERAKKESTALLILFFH